MGGGGLKYLPIFHYGIMGFLTLWEAGFHDGGEFNVLEMERVSG